VLLPSPVPTIGPTVEPRTPSATALPVTPTSTPPRTATSTPVQASTSTPFVLPTATSTLSPGSSPESAPEPAGNAFSGLVIADGIDADSNPVGPGTTFTSARRPLYVFFEYRNMSSAMTWGHLWWRGTQEMSRTIEKWPERWGSAGRAWIFYTPEGSFLPGNYEVQLLISSQVVATATFTIQ
jgi:hypothetical protein